MEKNNYNITKCHPLNLYEGVEQGTQEWLELREGRVTCSNAADLLIHGPVFCLHKNYQASKRMTPNGNTYADRGHEIEADVKERFNRLMSQNGFEIKDYTFLTNDFFPNAGYSPDGLLLDDTWGTCEFIPIEVKAYNDVTVNEKTGKTRTPNKHIKAVESLENMPLDARCQMQMEMLLTGADKMFLLLANPDCEDKEKAYKVWTVPFDPEIGKELADKLLGKDKIFEVWQKWPRSYYQFVRTCSKEWATKYKAQLLANAPKTFGKESEKLSQKLSEIVSQKDSEKSSV